MDRQKDKQTDKMLLQLIAMLTKSQKKVIIKRIKSLILTEQLSA